MKRFPNQTYFLFLVVVMLSLPSAVVSQRRDYMTDAEVELVREAQDIDVRIDVLTKMVDRRFALLGLDQTWKEQTKSGNPWGDPPKGTRVQLIGDIRSIIQKAVDDIDDVAMHNANTQTQNKTEGQLFPKAVRSLAAAAKRYRTFLSPIAEKSTDEKERGLAGAALELCDQIIEAAATLPAEIPKRKT